MRWLRGLVVGAVALLVASASTFAQTTTGTITGRIIDSQDLPVPGATITVAGPALQGVQTAVSSENGDYILPLLPPGTYNVTFELSGFQTQQKTATVAATQTVPLNVTLGPAAVEEAVVVVGRAADVLTRTAQVATNFRQEVFQTLPTNRDITATLLMAPAVHPTGPSGTYTIAGAMSFESLFMVNGVTANENIRGQPTTFNLYIEDAIQETVVAADGVSAEYGRFSGGVVNVITKSGTNRYAGSFRDTLNNDNWRANVVGNGNFAPLAAGQTTPQCNFVTGIGGTQIRDPECFSGDTQLSAVVPTYEYVIGGPIFRDRLTFFNAGRFQNQQSARSTVNPVNTPYTFEEKRQRYEIKFTGNLNPNNRFEGSYQKEAVEQQNDRFGNVMDVRSLRNRKTPLDAYQINYNGILSNTFFVEARFSVRQFSFVGSGARSRDLIDGTLLQDAARGNLRYWSSTFCGVCGPEKRDNDNEYVKATYFKSTKGFGSHALVFGVDSFNDKVSVNNHQSGSDYRIIGTTSIIRASDADCAAGTGCIFPQFLPGSTTLQYNPITVGSVGTNFRTNGFFVNDNIRWSSHLTFNVGLRWDKNDGTNSAGTLVASDSKLAPRVGVVWDPKGDGVWAVSGSYGIYTAAIANNIANSSSAAGNPATIQWTYAGPAINANINAPTASLLAPPAAIQQVFNWCARDQRGFCTAASPSLSEVPGVSIRVGDNLTSPNVSAYAVGVSRQVGSRGVVRADYQFRNYNDFYSSRIDRTNGTVVDEFGNRSDLAIIENTSDLKRRYSGVTTSATYRVSDRTNVGGNYTLSRLWGNFEGENVGSGPLTADAFQYPEYRQLSWYAPEGDLAQDQRHRSTLWINYGVPKVTGLSVSLLQSLASGLPYGAGGGNPNAQIGFSATASVDARPYVTNPGYQTPQGGARENYYYTARDAFRTEPSRRTDFAANYDFRFAAGARRLDAFVQAQVINIFNHQDLCACGASVFENGGYVALSTIGSGILAPVGTSTLARFNPFTETPVQGVNWNYAANFGTPLNRFAFTTPRMFRMSFGVRF